MEVKLTTINWPNLTYLYAYETYAFNGNKLPSSKVNEILAKLIASNVYASAIYLSQTVPAPPTGQGITDKATLIGRSNTVSTD